VNRRAVILALGAAQTLAWAGSYYIPAVLAGPMARDLRLATPAVFLAFSGALLLTAFLGPAVGRVIDRHGGRGILAAANLVFALGLVLLAGAQGIVTLYVAWAVMGLGMAMGLYDAAFATLARLLGREARGAITGITLLAGFASSIGWPLSAAMEAAWGWRGACLGWAAINLLICIPLNLSLPRAPAGEPAPPGAAPPMAPRDGARAAWLLAFVFAAGGFSAAALAAHLPMLLREAGATPAAAIFAASLMGPAQVGARLLEAGLLRRVHPLLSARLVQLAHPLGAASLLVLGAPAAAGFAVLHGAGNGILTIMRGTLPLVIFGPAGYGARQGMIVAPSRFVAALAPAGFGLVVERFGTEALWLTIALSLLSLAALMALRVPRESAAAPR
jgi:predicted MFS family arabinose efflux permease